MDTQYLPDDLDAISRQFEESGCLVITISLTHGHFDHYFRLQSLLTRFPEATAIAAPAVAADIARNIDGHRARQEFLPPGTTVDNDVVPRARETPNFSVDGVELHIIELPQVDVSPIAAIHIPNLETAVCGDAINNGIIRCSLRPRRTLGPNGCSASISSRS